MKVKKKNWIAGAVKDKSHPCTGSKLGEPTCKKGSRKYNLALTFKAIARKRKGK